MNISFRISNLTKIYEMGEEKVVALDKVSLEVPEGDYVAIMGPSGSGKSTLLNILGCLDKPTSGNYQIGGESVEEMNDEDLSALRAKSIGFIFQSYNLIPYLNVLENISLPASYEKESNLDDKKARELATIVGLGDRTTHLPLQLSGGQQQRVGIARSLAVEPDIWFLDEPFSALDPLIRKEMQDEFLRLQSVLNKTIMFVTHDFDEALRLADRIAIMKDGIIEQLDKPDNIVLNPATDYVKKFTEDVPREKVLKIESIMDASDPNASGEIAVKKDDIIETVAEKILNSKETIKVVDEKNSVVGSINPSKVIKVLFGE